MWQSGVFIPESGRVPETSCASVPREYLGWAYRYFLLDQWYVLWNRGHTLLVFQKWASISGPWETHR